MAKSNAVWGIDVGQCSLKAIRCALGSDGNHLVADAFDYIEYPKILTQPEADPVVLVREALELFLSRNDLGGDSVAISVPDVAIAPLTIRHHANADPCAQPDSP